MENIINNIREEKKKSEDEYNKQILKMENMSNNNNGSEKNENNKIEFSEKSINKIKMEFQNVVDDIELLNSNENGKYIQKDIILNITHKEEKDKIQTYDEISPQG